MSARLDGAGTSEAVWRRWPGPAAWPLFTPPACPRFVVVAPHPDDEALGVGGALRLLRDAGRTVQVVAVTDGEGSHPASRVRSPADLGARRRRERAEALARLGLADAAVRELGLPDGGVASHELDLRRSLAAVLDATACCLVTWRHDGHPDHEAAGRAAAAACAATGATLVEYPVWMWHWAGPGDRRVPWSAARRVDLPPAVRAAKAGALRAFTTQVRPLGTGPGDADILPPRVLERFRRPFEAVFG
ncbi:PIG-L family deacetylase [soil metagenome]